MRIFLDLVNDVSFASNIVIFNWVQSIEIVGPKGSKSIREKMA